MSTHFIFPKPRDWDTFEDIVCDVFARKFDNYNLQRYGRSGQRQFGVDIAGFTQRGLIGVQCKHHPQGNIAVNEIDEEITKSESFRPKLDNFFIATSADRDTVAHTHVLKISEIRETNGDYPIVIKFWDDIYNWLIEYPDLVYKHFTKYFPTHELEDIHVFLSNQQPKATVQWPTTSETLRSSIIGNLNKLEIVEPYKLTLGITTFPDVNYRGKADLELLLTDMFTDEASSEANFLEASRILKDARTIVRESFFSQELWIHLQTRITPAFLVGWIFRKVSHFDLRLVFNDQIWATSGLPFIPSRITDGLPTLIHQDSSEVAIVLNINRNIERSVVSQVSTWNRQLRAVLVYDLEGNQVTSAAHAYSIAIEISRKIKNLIDRWQIRKIHLFGALPAALAVLISFHLNAICPISIYYLDSSRDEYKLGGTLTNTL